MPSASAEKARQRPSGDSARWRLNSTKPCGVDMTVVPATTASSHSSRRSAPVAVCSATSDDEHIVSTVRTGPRRPRV